MNRSGRMCPMCHVGKLREKKTTFTQVFDGQVIVMPNVSALVCDVCGERTMDPNALLSLSGLLGIERPSVSNSPPEFPWKTG